MKKVFITAVLFVCVGFFWREFRLTRRIEERVFVLERMAELQAANLPAVSDSVLPPAQVLPPKQTLQPRPARPSATPERTFKSQKFSSPMLLDLNSVDSATLVRVPGIGATTATAIIKYRTQLGGFYSPRQIAERLKWEAAQEMMDEWCTQWFRCDTLRITRLNVNRADFRQLLRHPYLEYEQVKALVRYRDKHQGISGFDAIRMLEEFAENDLERLKYYLEF